MPLNDQYNHPEAEKRWQEQWFSQGTYHWDETATRENTFVVDTPPPTVSGVLHMGHIFSYTQADFVCRYQRMLGKTVFYPMGFDDNGLPTERLVEKVKKIRGSELPREEFIRICTEVVQDAEEEFRKLFKSIALSVDWRQEYQTISPRSRRISQASFLDLFHKNQAYRTMEPTLWDPADRTALAQAEIVDQDLPSTMNDILFTLEDGTPITIATTRPELLGACVAVFYNPEDERYQNLKGTFAFSPLFGVRVPVLADDKVDREKGTGLVMCCTFGDQTDVMWWKTYKLPLRMVLDRAGRISGMENMGNAEWPVKDLNAAKAVIEQLNGKKAKEARELTLELLKNANLLTQQQDIRHAVKCAERSGAPLEILVTPQWFVRVMDKKEELLKRASESQWHPAYMKGRMDSWIEGLSWDWCISRQRFFGVPFPVWYSKRAGEEGKILVADYDQLPVDPLKDLPKGYSANEVEPDKDVMDTWATSSVSPQLSSHGISSAWMEDKTRHEKLFPADIRPQAHEIIRTWAFYTMVKAHLHQQSVPWKHLMISGWCLASDKTKMSKSKGNVVTPVALIEEKGADAVRYWASTSRLGADTAFSEDVLKIGKKLVTKLWNATKFAAIHLNHVQGVPVNAADDIKKGIITNKLDIWVLTRLRRAVEKATSEFEQFEYCDARVAAEEFFWKDFCDNYLEMVKGRVYGEDEGDKAGQLSAAYTIYHCLEGILRLFAPFVPHITEELYQGLFSERLNGKDSVHARGMWPKAEDYPLDELAEVSGIAAVSVLEAVRKLKAERNVSLKWPLDQVSVRALEGGSFADIAACAGDLKKVMNAKELIEAKESEDAFVVTADNRFKVFARFAEKSDAA